MIRAAILDLDGLMVDTEPLGLAAWQRCMEPAGFQLEHCHYCHLIGLGQQETAAYLLRVSGADWTPDELLQRFWNELLFIIEGSSLEPRPGLLMVLEKLEGAGFPLGVASNSPTGYVEHLIDKLGLVPYFSAVLGAEAVCRAKPAPDIYLEAARQLGVVPEGCLAFEDSLSGCTAALAAGMRCFFIPNADLVMTETSMICRDMFASLEECEAVLDEILRGVLPSGE
jgi:HAD superfamily hydrolase (TIGR01509 family)